MAPIDAATHVLSPAMQDVFDRAAVAAATDANVLILGGPGVGKSVLARYIHRMSARAGRTFTEFNLGAFSSELAGSELFGVAPVASEPSMAPKAGLLESSGGGTVVLDDIGGGETKLMAVVLETIKTHLVYRRWADTPMPVDVRFIAISSDSPERESSGHAFGLKRCLPFFEVILEVPPLRERRSEIRELAQLFAVEQAEGHPVSIQDAAMTLLERNSWPGNIRELRCVMQRATVLCDGFDIGPEHLSP